MIDRCKRKDVTTHTRSITRADAKENERYPNICVKTNIY